jgi:hypothetical protein
MWLAHAQPMRQKPPSTICPHACVDDTTKPLSQGTLPREQPFYAPFLLKNAKAAKVY